MRTIRRYEIECDGKPHRFRLCYDPIYVATSPFRDQLYFWAEYSEEVDDYETLLQVFATDEPLPEQYLWLGSVIKGKVGDAVHLIALPPPEVEPDPRPGISELIERSSLGTPGAKALRARATSEGSGRVLTLARERYRLPGPVHRLIELLEKPGAELCLRDEHAGPWPVRKSIQSSQSPPAGYRSSAAMNAARTYLTSRAKRPARKHCRSTTGRKDTHELAFPVPDGRAGRHPGRSRVAVRGHRADGNAVKGGPCPEQ